MTILKKIDIHCHVSAFPDFIPARVNTKYKFPTIEQEIELQDRLNIEKGVLLPLVATEYRWREISNEECKFIADKAPDRFTWFCNIEPRTEDLGESIDFSELLNRYKILGAKGVGEFSSMVTINDPVLDSLFRSCTECNMPIIMDFGVARGDKSGVIDELGLPGLEQVLKRYPNLHLIGHSIVFWSEISDDITNDARRTYPNGKVTEGRLPKLMREYGNLYCDLSGYSAANAMMRDPEYAARFFEEFADRLYYGTDDIYEIVTNYQYDFDAFLTQMLKDGMLSQENYAKIIRKNAVKLLGLSEL